eukprot:5745350-Amphidinium_carterae.1
MSFKFGNTNYRLRCFRSSLGSGCIRLTFLLITSLVMLRYSHLLGWYHHKPPEHSVTNKRARLVSRMDFPKLQQMVGNRH